MGTQTPTAGTTPGPERMAAATPKLGLTTPTEVVLPTAPRIMDASVLPGFDVFTDMQLAVALATDSRASWFGDMQRALRERPELARQVNAQAAADAAQYLQGMLQAPLRSLAGTGASALNDQMLKAESLMEIGHYTEAADRYEAAHFAAPANPLPLLGKGHALLAAGQYWSAATNILRGVELADQAPGVAQLLVQRLDLKSLMGGGEIIDIRRADLMRQLERSESPELRFLLGYLEYHSGDHAHGLENLQRAADNPRASRLIAHYPALLRNPLRTPGGAPGAPPQAPAGANELPPPAVPENPSAP